MKAIGRSREVKPGYMFTVTNAALAVMATLGAARSAFGENFIVKDGQPRAEIVIAETPPRAVPLAAKEAFAA